MLEEIKITNFAIIENLSVRFHPGLNILTGETGAGKSIIIDALNLVLGGRADSDSIRTGADSATVEACFDLDIKKYLDEGQQSGLESEEGPLIVKRVISQSGKNRVYLNGSPVTVAQLAKIGNRLVDIHGQHDHQTLLYPENHVDLLDQVGGLMELRKTFSEEYLSYMEDIRQRDQVRRHQSERLQRKDLLEFQLNEIDSAQLSLGEESQLDSEKNKLRHAEKLSSVLQEALNLLSDEEGSVMERLGRVKRNLEPLPDIDPKLQESLERSHTAYCEAEELSEELRDYSRTVESNPARLEEIEDRLAEINGLKRKYGNEVSAVLEYRETIVEELETLSFSEEQIQELEARIAKKEKQIAKIAGELADKREKAALNVKKGVEKELKDLNMKHVRFEVGFNYPEDENGVLFRKKRVRLSSTGLGDLEFLFSPNPGEDARPLARIASGGELSRVMLSLKSLLNEGGGVPVMVFDEVDAGISGHVAEKVGIKLKKIADNQQVFCITHLPQIAGMAGAHYRVHKQVDKKRTSSTITELNPDERVHEIARLSGGETITEATLKHAREMIK